MAQSLRRPGDMRATLGLSTVMMFATACGSEVPGDAGSEDRDSSDALSDAAALADAGSGIDAGGAVDAAVTDSGSMTDSSAVLDAAAALDSSSTADSGPMTDAGPGTEAWTLTNAARRAFLYHYAPVLFVRAREGSSGRGQDWITNFDFDQDGDFSNNKDNWEDIDRFLAGQRPTWVIRPTLYTGLIEFMTGPRKDLVLLYHVYHAKQRGSIHDWERVEIRVNGVEALPGSGERVAYVVVTEHSKHNVRVFPNSDLNFLETGSGAHPMIWQAEGTRSGFLGLTGFGNAELHFVEDSWASIEGRGPTGDAEVDVNGDGDQDFHYLFVPQGDTDAVTRLGAQPLTAANARSMALGGSPTDLRSVQRITYELQDLADIFPTHWEPGLRRRATGPRRACRCSSRNRSRPALPAASQCRRGYRPFLPSRSTWKMKTRTATAIRGSIGFGVPIRWATMASSPPPGIAAPLLEPERRRMGIRRASAPTFISTISSYMRVRPVPSATSHAAGCPPDGISHPQAASTAVGFSSSTESEGRPASQAPSQMPAPIESSPPTAGSSRRVMSMNAGPRRVPPRR